MEKILISSCLLGEKVRYDGGDCLLSSPLVQQWQLEGRLISVCPEMAGGLPSPRPAAEISGNQVLDKNGLNISQAFYKGAEFTLDLAQKHQIHYALLKSQSPSCGNQQIYDGSFRGKLISGMGITARLLRDNGIQVFNEFQLEQLANLIDRKS